jgi:hypothetical protein
MNPDQTRNIALVFAIGFLTVFVTLLYLVPLAFRVVRERLGPWPSGGRAFLRSRIFSRICGILFALAGGGFVAWSWDEAHSGRFFSFKLAASGPMFIGMGAWLAIEGPEPSGHRPSLLGWILTALGLVAGLLYVEFLRTGRLPFAG